MDKAVIMNRSKAAFALADIQERFTPVINNIERIISKSSILVKAAELNIPLIMNGENKVMAIGGMRQSGVFIVSAEMLPFQLSDKSRTEDFRLISDLVK